MKKNHIYLLLIILASLISALGNIPYGFRFSYTVFPSFEPFSMIAGLVFALTASLANAALGSYSLLSMHVEKFSELRISVLILSILASIPTGFMCFLGYRNIIPNTINSIVSIMVCIVNSGIGYRAISNLIEDGKKLRANYLKWVNNTYYLMGVIPELTIRTLGFILGLGVSLVSYAAASDGMHIVFSNFNFTNNWISPLIYVLAVLPWIPSAALFANSTQQVSGDIYQKTRDIIFNKANDHINPTQLFIIIVSILSASSLCQIVLELLSPSSHIPELFKAEDIQLIIHRILAPITFISSACVNYLALTRTRSEIKNLN